MPAKHSHGSRDKYRHNLPSLISTTTICISIPPKFFSKLSSPQPIHQTRSTLIKRKIFAVIFSPCPRRSRPVSRSAPIKVRRHHFLLVENTCAVKTRLIVSTSRSLQIQHTRPETLRPHCSPEDDNNVLDPKLRAPAELERAGSPARATDGGRQRRLHWSWLHRAVLLEEEKNPRIHQAESNVIDELKTRLPLESTST